VKIHCQITERKTKQTKIELFNLQMSTAGRRVKYFGVRDVSAHVVVIAVIISQVGIKIGDLEREATRLCDLEQERGIAAGLALETSDRELFPLFTHDPESLKADEL